LATSSDWIKKWMITESRDLNSELFCRTDYQSSLRYRNFETINYDRDHLDRFYRWVSIQVFR